MRIWRLIAGVRSGEASPPNRAPEPHPPPRGAGRTPYPEYDVMDADKWAHDWDEKTRRLVLERIQDLPARIFFGEAEFAVLEAVCRRLLPQDDRPEEHRIPIAPYIDRRLATGEGDGYRYQEVPWHDEAYRLGLAGIEEASQVKFGQPFVDLDSDRQDQVLAAIEDGDPLGESWRRLPAKRFFRLLLQDIVEVYYSHPVAWNEIGFQGPASPRGHVRLGLGKRDPWEAEETAPLPEEERERVEDGGAPAGHGGATH
ncbi:MAG: gluconate 2-dehydrogenase subunit 3 family protein [Chloroflexota bacterium]|nr:gluconate 2-dehydrogenase subunit 3 family protein [Chloroflexota bacterium]